MANGVPGTGWVDTASKAITQVGFPVVIAGVLLWYLLTKFQDNMLMITDRMSANALAAASLVQAQTLLVEQEKLIFAEIKEQTGEMRSQTGHLKAIAEDSHALVDMRRKEKK